MEIFCAQKNKLSVSLYLKLFYEWLHVYVDFVKDRAIDSVRFGKSAFDHFVKACLFVFSKSKESCTMILQAQYIDKSEVNRVWFVAMLQV